MRSINNNIGNNIVVGEKVEVPIVNGEYVHSIDFDNAATTPPFCSVLNDINNFAPWYSSIHRGAGYKSELSSKVYDNARYLVQDFVHADKDKDVVIFTKNTTESINLLSYVLSQQTEHQNVVLSSWMEHASNDLPWRGKFLLDYIEIDSLGRLSLNDLENKLIKYKGSVKLVTITGTANVTGYINPIHEIASITHKYGAKIMVDGAQMVPHIPVDMMPFNTPEHIDFLVFSAHKMYAPFGIGVLIGPKTVFKKSEALILGGGTFRLYTHGKIQWSDPPLKDEAGTPNVMGVAALSSAIQTLISIGMNEIFSYEKALYDYMVEKMSHIPGICFYSDTSKEDTVSIVPFNMVNISHQLMATILANESGIAVRNGFFCAHPYCERLLGLSESDMEYYFNHKNVKLPGMVRVSLGLYNTYEEIDKFIKTLLLISQNQEYFIQKYTDKIIALENPGC
ncbi:aminotransferase class V-fold PLP-dependent enzyme [Anaerosacchariphilus polymeriproducens]|uniref:Aminotransferase class V-fold PLP-dependent enzyme n=1 Tax=Anaerosacchariphilus polymeriproducens TaxID=1812858 RepID=A0A371AW31_9FIRM|nr:aminotransferase class V-fold PLP-dependent enzyme [Anaerosacchariphilus polymeriproducens]RDU23749.1 aminotransferase class V-fold PLP-dependent enzyme [Anaerosacchariphilus polymeriproducens]